MPAAYSIGSRGILVEELQRAMGGLKADGRFGPLTRDAVMRIQGARGIAATGRADDAFYKLLKLPFPNEFSRCLCLTNSFEGTGFGGCNATDIDNAGLTFGIVGFTSEHGEVQEILSIYLRNFPQAANVFPPDRAKSLLGLIAAGNANPSDWGKFFYGSGFKRGASETMPVLPDVPPAFAAWGTQPAMRRLQAEAALVKWKAAEKTAAALGFGTMAGRGFTFDVVVQNGSFKPAALKIFKAMNLDGQPEQTRLEGAALAVARGSAPKRQADVLARKIIFSRRRSVVHDSNYDLDAQAFD